MQKCHLPFMYQGITVTKFEQLVQSVPTLRAFWDLEKKTVLHEIRVSWTVGVFPTSVKIPHLHVHKPKTILVETVLAILV